MPNSTFTFDSSPFARRVGEHSLWEESHDILYVRMVGTLHGRDLDQIMTLQDEWVRDKPFFFMLVDVRNLNGVTRDARPTMSHDRWPKTRPQIVAVFGMSFTMRTIGEMVLRARRVLNASSPMPTRLFNSELDARNAIAAVRRAKS